MLAPLLQCCAPFLAGFAGGNAQINQFFIAEQRHVPTRSKQLAPVKMR